MKELYFLTRLDMISGWFTAFAVISGILLVGFSAGYIISKTDYLCYNCDIDERWSNYWKKLVKLFIPIFIISLILSILTPTSKEAYAIYGIGGTLDYIQNDSTATQMPHKVIEAVDMWLDNMTNTK